MVCHTEIISAIVYVWLGAVLGTYNPFVDNIPFSIAWQGPELPLDGLSDDANSVVVMTNNQEKYLCTIPNPLSDDDKEKDIATYTGPSELELLQPLIEQTTCSYRIESYWTYELCHGKTLRQYHEEKDTNQKTKLQQYFLGQHKKAKPQQKDQDSQSATTETPPAEDEQTDTKQTDTKPTETKQTEAKTIRDKVPFKKVEGVEIPYFEMNFEDGTLCDLTGNPRRAAIQYVCQPEGTGEIYELKEIFTCEYEVIVLTSALCSHPLYQIKKDPINQIMCHPVDGAPTMPVSLKQLQSEQSKAPYNRRDFFIDLGQNEEVKPQELPRKVHFTYKPANKKAQKPAESTTSTISAATDKQVLDNFLKGEYCIHGGTGWWKHEFCYGKHVNQYHVDSRTGKTIISMGIWNVEDHLTWLENNPNKKPKKVEDRKYVSHFYGSGEVCDITGKPRQTEVKLKCVQSPSQPHAISIYLIEPSACVYLLVVESQLFCDLVGTADHNGLFP